MPIYEYVCQACDKRFETIVSASKKAHCPACDSSKLEQQFSAFAVGSAKGKGTFAKSAPSGGGGCGSCGDPRGPGSCSN
ncbi:MAG TPA: zinc ribbon domain-containing protein [Terriglobales bacterium]|nr:zinc ribbon domain-containing protein [Terriglobales bacterium]